MTQDRASGGVCASLSLVGQPTPIRPNTSPAAPFALALAVSILMTIYVIQARNRMTTATIFSFDGHNFIRVQTTLLTAEGKSAVNTTLDHSNPSYQALIQKRSYRGEATLFGREYLTYYAPLINEQGELDGAVFVGNQR